MQSSRLFHKYFPNLLHPSLTPSILLSLTRNFLPLSFLKHHKRHTLDRRLEGFHDFLQLAVAIVPMPREVLSFLELPPSHPIASSMSSGKTNTTTTSISEGTRSGMRAAVYPLSTADTSTSMSSHESASDGHFSDRGEEQRQGLGHSSYANTSSIHPHNDDNNNESTFTDDDDSSSRRKLPSNTPTTNSSNTKDSYQRSGLTTDNFNRKQSQGQGQGLGLNIPTSEKSSEKTSVGVKLSMADQQIR